MASQTPFLRAILPSLPTDIAKTVRTLCGTASEPTFEDVLDTLIRFISGAECAPNAAAGIQSQWAEKQEAAITILNGMVKKRSSLEHKRPREDDDTSVDLQVAKRQRSSVAPASSAPSTLPPDPLFTIHSVSATSPIRKKVNITVYKTAIVLTHPTSEAIEANIPLQMLSRSFIVPTRGKTKGHWTIVLLSSDTSDRGKPANDASTHPQVIFGIDSVSSTPFSTTTYNGEPTRCTHPKNTATRPMLLEFLNTLGKPVIEPTPDVFRSACVGIASGVSANEDGIPGIEAYRGAKAGSLWFTKEGILWGESKPCEFWAFEDLIGKSEGVRVVGGTGRTCTVVLTRKSIGDTEAVGDDEEDMGVEAEFSMVDSRERPGIDAWVRAFRNEFGKEKIIGEPKTIMQLEEDSDDADEDFEMDTDDGSEATSSDESDGDNEEGSEDAEASDVENGSGDEDLLTEEHHPLLRPGAVPRRMQRGLVDMVVGMVENDMLGSSEAPELLSEEEDGLGEDEEDELDD
ncbi:hypothetical protein H0H92_002001 [Tricholoma furcatifolium]|nr:hypothetical protein H0H92_002001 [Tricholoma furcatifolium]